MTLQCLFKFYIEMSNRFLFFFHGIYCGVISIGDFVIVPDFYYIRECMEAVRRNGNFSIVDDLIRRGRSPIITS